jgi:hypothetical protein
MHIFTNAEYADMLYIYGFCNGSATAAVEEYRQQFPITESWIIDCFPRCSIHCVKVVHSPVLMSHLNKHVNMWRNKKTFFILHSVALLLACKDFLHVSVHSKHYMMIAFTHFTHNMCKSTPRGECRVSRIFSFVTY